MALLQAASPSSGVLQLSQLPLCATKEDVRRFFGSEFPVLEGGIHWCMTAGYQATDTAFVELESDSVALEAVVSAGCMSVHTISGTTKWAVVLCCTLMLPVSSVSASQNQ